jgi:hypothetical protein
VRPWIFRRTLRERGRGGDERWGGNLGGMCGAPGGGVRGDPPEKTDATCHENWRNYITLGLPAPPLESQAPAAMAEAPPGVQSGAARGQRRPKKDAEEAEVELSVLQQWQKKAEATVTSMAWEMFMLIVVLAYFVVVFTTFAISDQKARSKHLAYPASRAALSPLLLIPPPPASHEDTMSRDTNLPCTHTP